MKLLEFNTEAQNNDIDLFPLYEGIQPSAMGLKKMEKKHDHLDRRSFTFLIDKDSFPQFRKSKELCREERLSKYYQKTEDYPEINKYIIETLCSEYPEFFSLKSNTLICKLTDEELSFNNNYELTHSNTKLSVPFVDLYDALAMQVPEDLVIHKVPKGQLNPLKSEEEKRDYASVIHLCHCNGWEAEWAINKSFDFIHEGVSRINTIIPNSKRMLLSFLKGLKFERIAAISFKTTPYLNRHSDDIKKWDKPFNQENPFMNVRVERQTVTGFEHSEAFLFTIKTYLYDMNIQKTTIDNELKIKRLNSIKKVFSNPDPKSYAYEVITENRKAVLSWIKKQMEDV